MSNTCTDGEGLDLEAGAVALAELVEAVRGADRLIARTVLLGGRLVGSGVAERVEGLPLEHSVELACRLTGADRRMLVAAGETLRDLPAVAGLFAQGALSWGQVRAVVAAARGLSAAQRRVVDARVGAVVEAYGEGVGAFDADGLVWAVEQAAAELRPDLTERAERRSVERSFLARQMSFDGGMRLYGELDPVAAAPVNAAIDAAAGRVVDDGEPEEPVDAGADVPAGVWTSTRQGPPGRASIGQGVRRVVGRRSGSGRAAVAGGARGRGRRVRGLGGDAGHRVARAAAAPDRRRGGSARSGRRRAGGAVRWRAAVGGHRQGARRPRPRLAHAGRPGHRPGHHPPPRPGVSQPAPRRDPAQTTPTPPDPTVPF